MWGLSDSDLAAWLENVMLCMPDASIASQIKQRPREERQPLARSAQQKQQYHPLNVLVVRRLNSPIEFRNYAFVRFAAAPYFSSFLLLPQRFGTKNYYKHRKMLTLVRGLGPDRCYVVRFSSHLVRRTCSLCARLSA